MEIFYQEISKMKRVEARKKIRENLLLLLFFC